MCEMKRLVQGGEFVCELIQRHGSLYKHIPCERGAPRHSWVHFWQSKEVSKQLLLALMLA